VATTLPPGAMLSLYRTVVGTGLDRVNDTGTRRTGVDVNCSRAPTVTKRFWLALEDLRRAASPSGGAGPAGLPAGEKHSMGPDDWAGVGRLMPIGGPRPL